MGNRNVRAFVALAIGGLLTLGAFLGTFFVAGVPDFGFERSPEKVETVRYRGSFEQNVNKVEFLANYKGFEVLVDSGAISPVEGTVTEASAEAVTIDTATGPETVTATQFSGATVYGHEYGRADWGQKIFYFHVPVALLSFAVFAVAAFYSARFIMTRRREYDTKSKLAMELTLLFITMTMITGVLWTKAAWGVWWDWEPRLTTYFIMTLLVIGYFVLRNAVEDEERRALYGAAFSILGFIDAPISFFITRLIPSTHPVIERGGLEPPMLASFLTALFGMMFVGYAIYQLRLREAMLRERLEQAKTLLER